MEVINTDSVQFFQCTFKVPEVTSRGAFRLFVKFVALYDPCHIYNKFLILLRIHGPLLVDPVPLAISSHWQIQIVPNSEANFSCVQF